VTDKTPREIVDAIEKALKETAARLAAKPKLHPARSDQFVGHGRPNTSREILDAIDRSLKETHRRIAERDY
jgi:hypothetical protein